MKTASLFLWVLRRDLHITWRNRSALGISLIFFVLVSSLFPLALDPNPQLLQAIATAVIWVMALLANLLSLGQIFENDWRDGTLTQLLLLPAPTSVVVAAKILAHWLSFGVPLLILTPFIAMQYQLPSAAYVPLLVGLLLGTPVLSCLGALTSALVLGLEKGAALLALLQLPLCVPVLVFGCQAVLLVLGGASAMPVLWILLALWLGTAFFTPYLCTLALKQMY